MHATVDELRPVQHNGLTKVSEIGRGLEEAIGRIGRSEGLEELEVALEELPLEEAWKLEPRNLQNLTPVHDEGGDAKNGQRDAHSNQKDANNQACGDYCPAVAVCGCTITCTWVHIRSKGGLRFMHDRLCNVQFMQCHTECLPPAGRPTEKYCKSPLILFGK